jgi:molybdopterin-guanine dinucleotide biosynthesis protein A
VENFPGPLAGILAALDWTATHRPGVSLVFSAAADCPFLPRDLVARLTEALVNENAQLAVAASDGQSHPVIGLWSVSLRDELRHALVQEDIRKIDRWTARYKLATVTWPTEPLDPFFNANTMDDIAEAERLAELDGG